MSDYSKRFAALWIFPKPNRITVKVTVGCDDRAAVDPKRPKAGVCLPRTAKARDTHNVAFRSGYVNS